MDMKMASMKMSPEDQEDMGASIAVEKPEYPYGLCLHLDNDQIEKLGLGELPPAGSSMMIHAQCDVRDVSVSDDAERGKQRRMSLQITDMMIVPMKAKEEPAKKLYGDVGF